MRVLFLNFHGSCSTAASGDPTVSNETGASIELAQTAVYADRIMPYSEMNCDTLRAFIGTAQPDQRMGIAMGRVVAHELYHVLLQTGRHSNKGIAKAIYSPAALLGRSLRFEAGELEKIREKYALAPRLR